MDFSLESLRDAFMDTQFKRSKQGRELYAILLATSLDEAFLVEYLSFYHELDSLTGDRVLVIGPQVRGDLGRGPFLSEDIHEFVRAGPFDYSQVRFGLDQRDFGVATDLRTFVRDQTRESYALARFLGIPFNSMPLLVFFDNLDSPQDRVYWSLRGKSGAAFVLDLRDLLQAVSDECGWDIPDRLKWLEKRAAALRGDYVHESDVPYEIREEWKAYRETKGHSHRVSVITAYYEQVAALRCAYEQARADTELKVPLDSVNSPIASLEAGRIYGDELSRLRKHHRRWSTRLPTDYREALRRLSYPDRWYIEVREGQLALTRDEAVREARRLEEHLHELEDAYESKRSRLVTKAEGGLAEAREYKSIPRLSPLKVIQNVLCEAAITIDKPTKSTSVRSIIESEPRRVPTVFISYSHESDEHAARVLELAQRLRSDGVDCWIDQFEQSPLEGFPRWMAHQISSADTVLLICTKAYRRRFDGLEERSKGLGVNFEGHLILQQLYDAAMRNSKFIPILLQPSTREDIPIALRGTTSFEIPSAYEALKDRIFNVQRVAPNSVGKSVEGDGSIQ
jgi:hypothetical protein